MSNYRRYRIAGGTYFFTVVTQDRQPLFGAESSRQLLRESILTVQSDRPFELVATVLLPDHLHCIWRLPKGDHDYSLRRAQIKERFSRRYLALGGHERRSSSSRQRHRERGIWQRRFWEHTILDEDDLKRCVDYIHWNPVKHGYVQRVRDWAFSSFHRFAAAGEYDVDWGRCDPCDGYDDPEWE